MNVKIFRSNRVTVLEDMMNAYMQDIEDVNLVDLGVTAEGPDAFLGWVQFMSPRKPQ